MIMVPESVRKANSRAVSDRTRWRQQYATVSSAIRQAKQRLRMAQAVGLNQLVRDEAMIITALRTRADVLMLFREVISADLRRTAYRYADQRVSA